MHQAALLLAQSFGVLNSYVDFGNYSIKKCCQAPLFYRFRNRDMKSKEVANADV